jgi:hypothetical protein
MCFDSARWLARSKARVPGFGRVTRFDRVTGLAGSIFFFKSKQRRFSKKKKNKSQQVCHRVLTGFSRVAGLTRRVSRVTPGFSFPCFFVNPARFRSRIGRVPDRPAGPDRVSKLWF